MTIRLIAIGQDGCLAEDMPLSEVARSVCETTAMFYQKMGFVRPWIGYLAQKNGEVVGTCAFKSVPVNGQVEIAYFTFPTHEGRGIATEMARQLVELARESINKIKVAAQTLPEENASTAILRKLGFHHIGTIQHPEDDEVWEWQMVAIPD